MNVCENGHKSHQSVQTRTIQGAFRVWNWEIYRGQRGYCTGMDDVSQTLLRLGVWEKDETEAIARRLKPGDVFLDFGAHIGWFTVLAATHGAEVHAYEGDAENLDLLRTNARLHGVQDRVTAHLVWVDADAYCDIPAGPIRLVKIDLEGNDDQAIRCLMPALQEGRVEELVVEVSPCFNDRYPALVAKMCELGYEVYRGNGERWNRMWDFHQDNFWFRRDRG